MEDNEQHFVHSRKSHVHIQESDDDTRDEVIIYRNTMSQSNSQNGRNGCSWEMIKRCTKFCYTLIKSITVEPIMFLFMFNTYIYLALIELYFYQQFGLKALKDNNSSITALLPNHSFCVNSSLLDDVLGNGTNDKVEGDASLIILINSALGQVTSVVVALIAGPLSDRYGRKPALLFALLGNTLASVINVLLVYFDLAVYYFIGSGLLMGATGGFTIIMAVSVAYVADVSSKQSLTFRIGILQAMLYISQALSDAVTGQWLKRSGCNFNPLLWLALSSSVLGVVYLIFLKEPFTKEVRIAKLQESGNLSLFSMLTRGFKIFLSTKYSKWHLWFTLVILSINVINGIGSFELLTLFQVHKPLEWGPGEIGWYGLSNTVIQAFSLFCILPILVYFKVPDSLIVLVGLFVTSGLNFFIGFLKSSWEMYLVGVLSGMDPTIIPIIRAIFSKLVSQDDQGSLFAIVTGVQVLSAAFASVLYNTVFRQILSRHLHPGLAFVLMGIIGLIPIPLVIVLFLKRKTNQTKYNSDNSKENMKQEESKSLLETD